MGMGVNFFENAFGAEFEYINPEQGLSFSSETRRLKFCAARNVNDRDLDACAALYGDPNVVRRFSDGVTKTREEVVFLANVWTGMWRLGSPFSGIRIGLQDGSPVGFMTVSDEPDCEIECFIKKDCWKRGLEKEALTWAVHDYIPAAESWDKSLVVRTVLVTVRPGDHVLANICERNLGMHRVGMTRDRSRDLYRLTLQPEALR